MDQSKFAVENIRFVLGYTKTLTNFIHEMMHLSKVIHIWETLFGYMIQKIIIFFMHRKLLPVCLEENMLQ